MMVLAGAQSSACWRRYSARPVRGRLGPEGGLRILLAQLVRDAQALDRSVRPILAYARDHYVRAYVEVRGPSTEAPPIDVIEPERWTGPSVGDRGPYGPLWLGPLFDPEVVLRLAVPTAAARSREVEQFIARLREETTVDRPFYYEANVLSSHLHLPSPPRLDTVREGLRALGYQVARTHARPEGFRTDAPRSEVEALFRRLSGG
jgi:tRNA (guanine26-N2/guanine27-N2)-dimethyltransferase